MIDYTLLVIQRDELLNKNAKLRRDLKKYKKLDAEAATYVETVICMCSDRFTGKSPYVGWQGLGLALEQDYSELMQLRKKSAK